MVLNCLVSSRGFCWEHSPKFLLSCVQARILVHGCPPHEGVTSSLGAQLGVGASTSSGTSINNDRWCNATGEVLSSLLPMESEWAKLIQACNGLIAFDAVLCGRESHHCGMAPQDLSPRIACVSLSGCQQCGSCPEGPAKPGESPENALPLLDPPPLHFSSVKAAQRPDTKGQDDPMLIARCRVCLKNRWCGRCNAWWCEACYTVPSRDGLLPLMDPPTGRRNSSIKVHNHLCVATCLMDESLNGVGEGGMWG